MAKAEGIPPTASVASVGPGINYIGGGNGHAFAYSGNLDHSNTFQDYFNFTTGSSYLVCQIAVAGDWDSIGANDIITQISLNGVVVILDDTSGELAPNTWPIELIIPPYTVVQIEGKVSTGTGKKFACILTGRSYGVV